ncbi:MAG: nucleoid occlusion protein [Defluviitaleaceae bacterium]|nr:nucleoid occlusion protein [Defluviitaleaceae bacterium]
MLNLKTQQLVQNETTEEIRHLKVSQIIPNRQQPRSIFNDEKIFELAESIKEHGIIQPIVVRQIENGYELIAGERRFRAIKSLDLETIPAIIKNYDDVTTASVAIIENIQREDLTSIEEALAYKQLMTIHGTTQSELAAQIGKSQSTVANKVRLLNLTKDVQNAILERKISERHARTLLSVKDEKLQVKFLKTIIEKNLNVAQTEQLIEDYLIPKENKQKVKTITKIPRNFKLAMNTFNQAAQMVEKTGVNVDTHTEETDDAYIITISLKK